MRKINDKVFFKIALTISIVVFILVVILNRRILNPPTEFPDFIYHLPKLHATINGICSALLLISLQAIRSGKIQLHKILNITTFVLSAIFLISYVVYHFFVPETTFGGTGTLQHFYYFTLITHIILAACVLPLSPFPLVCPSSMPLSTAVLHIGHCALVFSIVPKAINRIKMIFFMAI